MIGDAELGHNFGKGMGDAGRELEQGKPVERASLWSFFLPSGFLQALQSQFCASLWGFFSRPLRGHPWYLLAGFQPAWPCLEVVRVNVQHRHSRARDEICAQKEMINK